MGLRRGPRPERQGPAAVLRQPQDPGQRRWNWILGLRGHNINNAAAGVIDYRTGEVLAYVGSASYTSKGNKKFQPQFDVLADGWRQPGSAIKPIDYAIGIDDKTLTAATMFMDVTTNFGGGFIPTQADKLERGPVRLRSALQFSLNIPAIKGDDHDRPRPRLRADQGLRADVSRARPSRSLSMGIGTLEVHPIDLLGAYGTIANSGVQMPRRVHQPRSRTRTARSSGRSPATSPRASRSSARGAAYIITDILAGNTDMKVNPFWGKWAIYDGETRRPAAYKTGTTSDNRDVAAYGYLAPPTDKKAPALAVGVWMGNSDNTPNDGKLSLDTSAPLWSAILTEISKGEPIAQFKPPTGLKTATVDAFTGLKPGPFTTKTVKELFLPGTVPTQKETIRIVARRSTRRAACSGRTAASGRRSRAASSTSPRSRPTSRWQKADRNWAARAAKGAGVRGGPKGTRTAYFYSSGFYPVRADAGARRSRRRSAVPARRRSSRRPSATRPAAVEPSRSVARRRCRGGADATPPPPEAAEAARTPG